MFILVSATLVAKRTKEIGIRRFWGADASNIVRLLSKDFVVLVFVAALVAFPVAWWAIGLKTLITGIDIPVCVCCIPALVVVHC